MAINYELQPNESLDQYYLRTQGQTQAQANPITSAALIPTNDLSNKITYSPAPVVPNYSNLFNTEPIVPTAPETEIQKRINDLLSEQQQVSGQATFQTQQEAAQNLPALRATQNDLRAQQQVLLNEAAQLRLNAPGPGQGGLPTIQIQRDQAEKLRQNAVSSLGIQALLSASQGQVATAQDLADRAVKAKFDPIKAQIEANINNLNLIKNSPDYTIAERNRAQKQLDIQNQRQAFVEQQRQNTKDVNTIALEAAKNGADSLTLQKIMGSPNPAIALQNAGTSLGKKTLEIQNLTIQEKKLAIQKAQNDLNNSNSLTAETSVTGQRPLGVESNKVDKATGLTPNAVYQAALGYALTGKTPSLGLGTKTQVIAQRTAIFNTAGALLANAGVDLPAAQAEYKANQTSLNKILPLYNITQAAENTASANLDLALNQSGQVARTNAALANRYLQWAQGNLTEAKGLTKFETFIYTASREYAKVTSGAAASAAGLTDSAAREAGKLLNTAKSPGAFEAAVGAMKQDMANVTGNYENQIRNISGVIGNILGIGNTTTHNGVTLPSQNANNPSYQGIQLPH